MDSLSDSEISGTRPRLTRIGVGRYKSILELQPLEIRPLNILIGANGAGKSNLISFLRLLRALADSKLQEFVGLAGGPNELLYYGVKQSHGLWGSLEFETKTGRNLYLFQLVAAANDSLVFGEEQVEVRVVKGGEPHRNHLGAGHKESQAMAGEYSSLQQLLSQFEVFQFEDTSATSGFRRRGYIEDNRTLRGDGGNLAAFLLKLRERHPPYYRRIVASIRQVAPFFDDFQLQPMALDPQSILLNWRDRDSDHLFGPHQLSDGTLRVMALITLLLQPPEELPGLIVLDEPEIGLHPYAIEVLAGLIKGASVHRPVIVATQSTGLVNCFGAEDVITVTREKAQSKFIRQDSESLSAWLEEYAMGDIWTHNLIGGNPAR